MEKKKSVFKLTCCLTVALMVSVFVFLILIDVFHSQLDSFYVWLVGRENYFKGENWFSVFATFIASIPGVFCGVFAIVQTQRLNELEQRYHRPSIGLQKAILDVTWLNETDYKEQVDDMWQNIFLSKIVEKNKNANYLSLYFILEIKNDIEVDNIHIDELQFSFEFECYKIKLLENEKKSNGHFLRKYEDGKYLCELQCEMYPYLIQSQDECSFWKAIDKYTNYDNLVDDDYKNMLIEAKASIDYEYSIQKKENIMIKTVWKAPENGVWRKKAFAHAETYNGYTIYKD